MSQKKCRSCLSENAAELHDWKEANISFYEGLSYADAFHWCTQLPKASELPQMLCKRCALELPMVYCFLRRAKESEQKLRSLVQRTQTVEATPIIPDAHIKTEFVDEPHAPDFSMCSDEEPANYNATEASDDENTCGGDYNMAQESARNRESDVLNEMRQMLAAALAESSNDEHKNLLKRFTEEFYMLQKSVEELIDSVRQNPKDSLSDFPLNCMEDILEFDKHLCSNKALHKNLLEKFSRQSNTSLTMFITGNLRYLFKDDGLSRQFAWTNANGNTSVKNLCFIRLLKDASLSSFPLAKLPDVESVMKKYFLQAKDRFSKLEKRKRARQPSPSI